MRRVVVTGIGVIAPTGINIEEFWSNSVKGKSGVSDYDNYPNLKLKSRVVGKITKFNYKDFGISDIDYQQTGRPTQFAIAATNEALKISHITSFTKDQQEKTGICISTAIADSPFCEKQFEKIIQFYDKSNLSEEEIDKSIYPHFFSKGSFSDITTKIASIYNIKGDVFTMSTGCVGGTDAIGYAFDSIRNGEIETMICGASEAPITGLTFASFDIIDAISKKNTHPKQASSPYDVTRDGFVLSEGAGIVILESLEHAKTRNAPIYAEILSYETCNNAIHMTSLPKDGKPLAKIMKRAIEAANIRPCDIDYINAHGSSTPQNDVFETNAYKEVFGEYAYKIPISSNKSIMGHPLGAASAIEFVRSCLSIKNSIIPPTINLNNPDPECDLDYVPNVYREKKIEHMILDASGFSGIHSCIVMKKYK
ncbi:beta-ketoacyl-[acyl-carrier-protein] synthase family protein [Clostridium botulinum]|uniref:Beta-ketoacyl-[acyl-carrier-protein] synthase family protein n=1 Tax=Clostridium botulinum TaxID=1491 RepID=A0A6M0SR41_CLOBO|nr:beta-ketoacyl-[acyl-carrier-protein] synthase family protein [Clostridium botulinum]